MDTPTSQPNAISKIKPNRKKHCDTCNSQGWVKIDTVRGTNLSRMSVCPDCCLHNQGFWQLKKHYGNDNGKWCCLGGCGKVVDERPKNTDYKGNPVENTKLSEL